MMDKRMDVDKHNASMPSASRHPIHKDPPPIDRNSYMEKVSELLLLKQQCSFSLLLQTSLVASVAPSAVGDELHLNFFLLLDLPTPD